MMRNPVISARDFDLVRVSAVRALKSRYRGSALGVLWSFASPLLMTTIYSAIFGTAFSAYYDNSIVRYLLSAFVGIAAITFFSQATGEALSSVVANGGLLNKIALPSWTFPIASVAANTFQQALTMFPALLIMSALVTHDPVRVILVPIVLAAFIIMIAGFALALSALFVFYRDMQYLWGIIAFILWMTSPVFYPAALVPAVVRPWVLVNPVGSAISALRTVTIDRGPIDVAAMATFGAIAVGCAVAGAVVFARTRSQFMDLL